MKKILMTMFMACFTSVFAQTESLHTVQRGETLETIATKYGVTVDALKQANKDAQQYLYAGMKLVIPQKNASVTDEKKTGNRETTNTNNYGSLTQERYGSDANYHTENMQKDNVRSNLETKSYESGIITHIGWGKMTDLGKEFTSNTEVAGGLGYRHYIQDSFFAEGLLEYRIYSAKQGNTLELKENDIIIPLHVGLDFDFINIFTGPRLTFPVSRKATMKIEGMSYTNKEKTNTYAAFEIGADLFSFVRVSYAFGMGGNSNSYFNVGIVFCM